MRFSFIKNITIFVILIVMLPFVVYAAPSITSISGTVSHGQTVTVNGSGFGVKSPVAPAVWDNGLAYSLSNGACIPTPNGSPSCVGSNPYGWNGTGGKTTVYYKTSNPRGVWTPHYTNQWASSLDSEVDMDGLVVPGVSTTKQMYVTFWTYLTSTAANGGNKYMRLLSGAANSWGDAGNGTFIWAPDGHFEVFDFSSSSYLVNNYNTPTVSSFPSWNRMEAFADSSGSGPIISVALNNTASAKFTASPTASWYIDQLAGLGADFSATPNEPQQPTMDWGEIYADNTQARVEICNASSKTSSTHCEIQIPQTTWIDGQLQIQINQGSFANSSTAYLFVVDAAGNVSTGKQITFGGSVASGPTTPQGLIATVQ
jgi:hypothetical protein